MTGTIRITKIEYHYLQQVADIMRRDYIAVHAKNPAENLCANAEEWDGAIEKLDAV